MSKPVQWPVLIILSFYFSLVIVGATVKCKIENSNIWSINHKRNVFFSPLHFQALGALEELWHWFNRATVAGILWKGGSALESSVQELFADSSLTGQSIFSGILWAPGNSAPNMNRSISVRKPHKSGLDLDLKVGQISNYLGMTLQAIPQQLPAMVWRRQKVQIQSVCAGWEWFKTATGPLW